MHQSTKQSWAYTLEHGFQDRVPAVENIIEKALSYHEEPTNDYADVFVAISALESLSEMITGWYLGQYRLDAQDLDGSRHIRIKLLKKDFCVECDSFKSECVDCGEDINTQDAKIRHLFRVHSDKLSLDFTRRRLLEEYMHIIRRLRNNVLHDILFGLELDIDVFIKPFYKCTGEKMSNGNKMLENPEKWVHIDSTNGFNRNFYGLFVDLKRAANQEERNSLIMKYFKEEVLWAYCCIQRQSQEMKLELSRSIAGLHEEEMMKSDVMY